MKSTHQMICASLGLLLVSCSTIPSVPDGIVTGEKPAPSPTAPIVSNSSMGQILPLSASFKVADQVIKLEVARTPDEQATGLMYRTSLADDRGMLFPFNPPRPTQFWMKNTLIPLDMLFLRNGIIRSISANVPPCQANPCPTYGSPTEEIDQVIELRAGRAAELNLKAGDRITIQTIK
ncbi:DUF192 domain-containing protein [Leptolyngbya sp. FACHB-17]|uniref:DUF192 domain-containing protein n=1 Tax=unclassified Leptolyngbya TaxID=2650499 RepID=UPI00168106BA|nr:DUF192 domain-containing protein [Leptolyngbya sp. FACHB-17]MBD2078543.1 DUF192 domain-containing protein [Leptolyngbya sp. FACHB-17]